MQTAYDRLQAAKERFHVASVECRDAQSAYADAKLQYSQALQAWINFLTQYNANRNLHSGRKFNDARGRFSNAERYLQLAKERREESLQALRAANVNLSSAYRQYYGINPGYDQYAKFSGQQQKTSASDVPPPSSPPPGHQEAPKDPRPSKASIEQWFHQIDDALADHSKMRTLPTPPAWPCNNLDCKRNKANGTRILEACPCCIRYIFQGRDFKNELLRFHPDKFSRCPEEVEDQIQKMAKEIFVVVDEMYKAAHTK
jgi:hypothetical protein